MMKPRAWRHTAATIALCALLAAGGCKSSDPDKPWASDWPAPVKGPAAAKPPVRMTSSIAPAPEPDLSRPTNAAAAPAKSLNESLDQLKVAPPTEPQTTAYWFRPSRVGS